MSKSRRTTGIAAGVAMILFLPLLGLFGWAMADGDQRRRIAPLQAFFGNNVYQALVQAPQPRHYLGAARLAPDFTLRDREGRPWQLSKQRGRVVVINFWSITCPPCLEEMPSLLDLANVAHQDRDIEVVAISVDDRWDAVAPYIPKGSALKVLLDPSRKVARELFGTRLYPETWIIDSDGVVRLRYDGPRDWSSALSLQVIRSFR